MVRRYLGPKNIPKTPSQEVFGRLGFEKLSAVLLSSLESVGEEEWDFLNADMDKLTFVVVREPQKTACRFFG